MDSRFLVLLAPLLLGGCLAPIAPNDRTSRVRLGQVAGLGQVRVVPQQILEDSRCPSGAQCPWAGQLRVRALVDTPLGDHLRTLTLGEPERIGGGTLLLESVTPRATPGASIPARDYSFTFRYIVPSTR